MVWGPLGVSKTLLGRLQVRTAFKTMLKYYLTFLLSLAQEYFLEFSKKVGLGYKYMCSFSEANSICSLYSYRTLTAFGYTRYHLFNLIIIQCIVILKS